MLVTARNLTRAGSASIFFVVIQVACSPDRPARDSEVDGTADSRSAFVLENLPRYVINERTRIDGYEADLVPISWLGVSPSGTVAVFQPQDYLIRFFDGNGNPIGRIGRRGKGPGEFDSLIRGGWLADTLWVSDPALARITLIGPQLSIVRTVPPLTAVRPSTRDAGTVPVFPFIFPYGFYAGDTILVHGQWALGDPVGQAFADVALLRASRDGIIQRVVLRMSGEPCSLRVDLPDGGVGTVRVPLCHRPVWVVSPDGRRVLTVKTDVVNRAGGTYIVEVFDNQGLQLLRRTYPFHGVPIPQEAIDSTIAAQVKRTNQDARVRQLIENEARYAPPVYQPVVQALIDQEHRIWLGLRPVAEGRPWLVLDERGEPQGVILLPLNATLRAATSRDIWVTERDEVDVESVVRYEVRR